MYRALRKGGTAIVWYDLWKLSHLASAMTRAGKMIRAHMGEDQPRSGICAARTSPTVARLPSQASSTANLHSTPSITAEPIATPSRGIRGLRVHPTQKPLALFSELVRVHSKPGPRGRPLPGFRHDGGGCHERQEVHRRRHRPALRRDKPKRGFAMFKRVWRALFP